MKKKLRILSAVLVSILVFLGTAAVSATSSVSEDIPGSNDAAYIMITKKNRPLETIDSSLQIFAAQTSMQTFALVAPSSSPSATPFVLADILPVTIDGVYQPSEEDVYQPSEEYIYQYSEQEKILIARVVYSEARGEKFEGQVAVAAVVLNRFESGLFGKTIKKIVFAPSQFAITEKYNNHGMAAVDAAIEQRGDYPEDMYFFQVSRSQIWRNFDYYDRIGGHSFYCAAD